MPNEPVGQFPSPTSGSNPPTIEPTPTTPPEIERSEIPSHGGIKLTDEVAPDLSSSPLTLAPIPEPQPAASPPPPPQPTPATLPSTKRGGPPITTLLLLLIAIIGIAATYFFYQQTKTLSSQLIELERTLERRRIEDQLTPTPTETISPTLEVTPTSTEGATPTETISPTISQANPLLVFDGIRDVLSVAQRQYSSAQLLMVVTTGIENQDMAITKYWFRQTPNEKKYLYILREAGKPLSLVDQQVYLTPDNNIPSLNQLALSNGLGIDLSEALSIAATACPEGFNCAAATTSAQYIKANTTLWQITYKPADGGKPYVVQIDSVTKRILFKSL